MKTVFVLCVGLLFSSCAEKKKDEKKPTDGKKEDTAPKLVGRVQSRPGLKDYVLIEAYEKWKLADGVKLFTLAEGRAASLETSGEKLGDYIAADVKGGDVQVGDAVYFRPDVKVEAEKKPEPEKTEKTEKPKTES